MADRRGHDGDDGWRMWHGRLVRDCDCDDWGDNDDAPVAPGTPHQRERVKGAPVEICYYADHEARVITVLVIRTMELTSDG